MSCESQESPSFTPSTSISLTQSWSSKTDEFDISNESDFNGEDCNSKKLESKYNVDYLSVLQYIKNNKSSKWNFYLRETAKNGWNPSIFNMLFEFKDRNMRHQNYPHFYVKSNSSTSGQSNYDWAQWKKKKYKQYNDSKGYWKLLRNSKKSNHSNDKKIRINHLNCILSILRNKILTVFQANNFDLKCKNEIIFTFLNEEYIENDTHILHNYNNSDCDQFDDDHIYFTNRDISAEYKLTFWNGYIFGPTSISLLINNNKTESHFIYFPSQNYNINWMWYDNDDDEWKMYSDDFVKRSLEASYFGVQNHIFPVQRYKIWDDDKINSFNYCSLPSLTKFVSKIINKRKPFIFNMFDQDMTEIIAINNGYDNFATNIRRIILLKEEEEETQKKSIEQESYSAFIVPKYIKYHIIPILESDLIIPIEIIMLCHKYYFQNVIQLQL